GNDEGAAKPAQKVQLTGRVIHTWRVGAEMRVFLVVDGFVFSWDGQQVSARRGVVWFDEAKAKKTGKFDLGVYAEGNATVQAADGSTHRHPAIYMAVIAGGEFEVNNDEELRGAAGNTALYLRAKMRREDFIKAGGVALGAAKAGRAPGEDAEIGQEPIKPVPQVISVIPKDKTRQVDFTSEVEQGQRISTWTGSVYILRGEMELSADNVVIWVDEEAARKFEADKERQKEAGEDAEDEPADKTSFLRASQLAAEAYLEGNVTISLGERTVFASKVFYDFQRDRAIILDGKIKTYSRARDVPVYYYAKRMRQVGRGIFEARGAKITTCEFGHPHYDVGSSRLRLFDLTRQPAKGEKLRRHIRYSAKHAVTRVRGIPTMWWPYASGELEESATALRTVRIVNQTNLGTGIASQWHLFKLLGLDRPPQGFKLYLDLDWWKERGPAIGVESKYARRNYFGEGLAYYIDDHGDDRLARGVDLKPPRTTRGRFMWRHRQYFPEPWQKWELTLETSYLSDANFLNEYFREEFKEGKTQETVAYLKYQERDTALTILLKPRINDFLTVTEYFPRVDYKIIGRSLLGDRLTYFSHNEIAGARFSPDHRLVMRGSPATFIGDTLHEVDWPLSFAPVKVVPYVELRGSYFSDVMAPGTDKERVYGSGGFRAATQLWRVFENVESEFWNLHRMRHVNTFELYVLQASSSVNSRDLWAFDVPEAGTPVVQGVDDTDEVRLLWRQRFQTMRGIEGSQRSVDWLSIDTEARFYSDGDNPHISPEGDRLRNQLDVDARWLVSDQTSVLGGLNVDTDRKAIDTANIGLAVTRSPRMSYYVGLRYVNPADSNRAVFSLDYVINPKWRLRIFQDFDIEEGENASSRFALVRTLHRWTMTISLNRDAIREITGIMVELQPIGAPEVKFGM
ncbi:MAG: LptA/OstA family protein, partial [Phycisphaerae bacterium]|nr:LptA/OstA family protein [Phycisphaerae bacterium]